jgi:hypothetical protein
VTLAGENLKLLIFTASELPPDPCCDDEPLEFAEALGLFPPPQPASSRPVTAMTTSELMAWRGFTGDLRSVVRVRELKLFERTGVGGSHDRKTRVCDRPPTSIRRISQSRLGQG